MRSSRVEKKNGELTRSNLKRRGNRLSDEGSDRGSGGIPAIASGSRASPETPTTMVIIAPNPIARSLRS